MSLKGIDVSIHDGKIDWKTVKKNIDFAIIRAGYGKNNIDKKAVYNVTECTKQNIPIGLYWFSYALSKDMVVKEANYLCDFADKYKITYPLCYDWEYDSDEYAKKSKTTITNEMRKTFAIAFLETVKSRGYIPMLYTNIDYLNKGFKDLLNKYPIWLAQWGVKKPSIDCAIWQDGSIGIIDGIKTKVDTNISYLNYANTSVEDKEKSLASLKELTWEKYVKIANDVIAGKYGNGSTRKKKILSQGYDYNLVQSIVNILVK